MTQVSHSGGQAGGLFNAVAQAAQSVGDVAIQGGKEVASDLFVSLDSPAVRADKAQVIADQAQIGADQAQIQADQVKLQNAMQGNNLDQVKTAIDQLKKDDTKLQQDQGKLLDDQLTEFKDEQNEFKMPQWPPVGEPPFNPRAPEPPLYSDANQNLKAMGEPMQVWSPPSGGGW